MADISNELDRVAEMIAAKSNKAVEEITTSLMELVQDKTAEEAAEILSGIHLNVAMESKMVGAMAAYESGIVLMLENMHSTAMLSEGAMRALLENSKKYLADLIVGFKNLGGTIIEEEVKDILSFENKIKIETKENKFICDDVVITAGVFSEKLSKKYGANVPMQSERGYHLELSGTNVKLKYPLMNGYLKLAITPRPSGIRFAGLVEFGSIDSNPNTKAYDLLIRNAKSMFPKITFKEKQEWSGHRPATVDSLPLIGPSQINEKVFFAYGHHHIGLTAGPKTGELISKSILRDNDQIDLTAYKPNR